MLRIIISVLVIFLTSCAGNSGGHYTQTIQSWRGASASSLIRVWGNPDEKITERSGKSLFIYTKESFSAEQKLYSPAIGVSGTKDRPVIIETNNINEIWNKNLALKCTVMFIANPNGVITHTKIIGQNCFIKDSLARSLANPK